MARRSGSTLFLMEQLIVVAVFAICAAACVRIMTGSYFLAEKTRDISNAIETAESAAEKYKAVSGDVRKVAGLLGGIYGFMGDAPAAIVYYNEDWHICDLIDDASYKLSLTSKSSDVGSAALFQGELKVEKLSGEVIITFPIAAKGDQGGVIIE